MRFMWFTELDLRCCSSSFCGPQDPHNHIGENCCLLEFTWAKIADWLSNAAKKLKENLQIWGKFVAEWTAPKKIFHKIFTSPEQFNFFVICCCFSFADHSLEFNLFNFALRYSWQFIDWKAMRAFDFILSVVFSSPIRNFTCSPWRLIKLRNSTPSVLADWRRALKN